MMNNKKNLAKPKTNVKISSTPELQLKTAATVSNISHNTENTTNNLGLKGRLQVKPMSPKNFQIIKPQVIKETEVLSSSASELAGSEIERQQLLQLQIKHLKRQNAFLKKKLQQMATQQEAYYPKKKTAPKNKGYQPPNIESLHLNVKYFFQQINNLLASITKLFKLNINQDRPKNEIDIENEKCPVQREYLFRKYILNRRLQKIALQGEEKRYPALLQIFTEYYVYKQEAQHRTLQHLDAMIVKTNQLNKWLLEKAQIKRLRSEVYSRSNKDSVPSQQKGFGFKFLKPEPHNRFTFSPAPNKQNPYRRAGDLSP